MKKIIIFLLLFFISWIVFWYISNISSKWYINEARNMKTSSDLSNIFHSIENYSVKWWKLENLVLNGNKIHFKKLQIMWGDLKQSDWSDYLIFINEKDKKYHFCQLFWYTINQNWDKVAVIVWNYYQANEYDPKSLVRINWKIIENWDVIE